MTAIANKNLKITENFFTEEFSENEKSLWHQTEAVVIDETSKQYYFKFLLSTGTIAFKKQIPKKDVLCLNPGTNTFKTVFNKKSATYQKSRRTGFGDITKIKNKKYLIVFDTETTGLRTDDKIVQLSAIKLKISEGKNSYIFDEVGRFDEYINPKKTFSKKALEINKISKSKLKGKETEDVIIPKFKEFCGDNFIFLAHFAPFDDGMLSSACSRIGLEWDYDILCSYNIARKCYKLESYKLESIAKEFNLVSENNKFHDSMYDVEVTSEFAKILINEAIRREKNVKSK